MNKIITEFDELLEKQYPDVHCGLEAGDSPYRLLMMAILSAQCTDKRVNEVSHDLFARYPDMDSLAGCDISDLEYYIKSCGLYRAKAKNMKACAEMIVRDFNGQIPSAMDELLKLPGVGRKIGNLVRGDIFMLGGIVADTHLIRISNRLGFADSTDPYKVERALTPHIPIERQSAFCHRVVHFGREICSARSPKCNQCFVGNAGLCHTLNNSREPKQ